MALSNEWQACHVIMGFLMSSRQDIGGTFSMALCCSQQLVDACVVTWRRGFSPTQLLRRITVDRRAGEEIGLG